MIRKLLMPLAIALSFNAFADKSSDPVVQVPEELKSRLDRKVFVRNFGDIAYRAPLPGNQGPVVVLYHGIYGGSSHLSFRELLDELDKKGARVYLMDLPGTAESNKKIVVGDRVGKTRKVYTAKFLTDFVSAFMRDVVNEPAVLVGQATASMAVLEASKSLNSLVTDTILISPSGVNVLSKKPDLKQTLFFNYLKLFPSQLDSFYMNQLLSDENIRGSVAPGLYDQSLVTDVFLTEYRLGKNYLDQKWVSLSFVGGKLSQDFRKVNKGVTSPVLMIFGKEDKGISISDGAGNINNTKPDREEDFRAIRPDFDYLSIPKAAALVFKEKAEMVADIILERQK